MKSKIIKGQKVKSVGVTLDGLREFINFHKAMHAKVDMNPSKMVVLIGYWDFIALFGRVQGTVFEGVTVRTESKISVINPKNLMPKPTKKKTTNLQPAKKKRKK